MQVTKEGIERIKSANDLGAVVAERGIELRKKGRQLVAPLSLPRGEDGVLQRLAGEGALPLLRLRRRRRRDRLRHQVRQGELRRRSRDAGPPRGASTSGSSWRSGRGSCRRRRSQALTPPPNGKRASHRRPRPKARSSIGAPPAGRALPGWSSTTTGPSARREDAQAYLKKRGLTDLGPLAGAQGRLRRRLAPQGDPEGRRGPGAAPGARRHHGGGPRAPRRLHRGPDPGSSHRPVDEPLRPRAADAASLLPSRPTSRRLELPGRALSPTRSCSPSRSSMRSPSTRSGSRRDPDLRHERLHGGPPRHS